MKKRAAMAAVKLLEGAGIAPGMARHQGGIVRRRGACPLPVNTSHGHRASSIAVPPVFR